jgi:hypothetical protein
LPMTCQKTIVEQQSFRKKPLDLGKCNMIRNHYFTEKAKREGLRIPSLFKIKLLNCDGF